MLATKTQAITPSDSSTITPTLNGLYVGSGGDVALMLEQNSAAVTFSNVPSGSILPLRIKQVMATNTTATYLVGLN